MIPYADLVDALAAWRARQGLPVVKSAGAPTLRAAAQTPTSPRLAVPPPGPARPAPPPAGGSRPVAPPPVDSALDDFDEGVALIEDAAYDAGEDYVLRLGDDDEPGGEPTAIGGAPGPGTPASSASQRDKRNNW